MFPNEYQQGEFDGFERAFTMFWRHWTTHADRHRFLHGISVAGFDGFAPILLCCIEQFRNTHMHMATSIMRVAHCFVIFTPKRAQTAINNDAVPDLALCPLCRWGRNTTKRQATNTIRLDASDAEHDAPGVGRTGAPSELRNPLDRHTGNTK